MFTFSILTCYARKSVPNLSVIYINVCIAKHTLFQNIFCQDECKTGHEETFIKILNKWRNNCLLRNTINVPLHISLKSIKGIVSRNVNLRDTAPLIKVKHFYKNSLGYHCQQCRLSASGCLVSYFICMNIIFIL